MYLVSFSLYFYSITEPGINILTLLIEHFVAIEEGFHQFVLEINKKSNFLFSSCVKWLNVFRMKFFNKNRFFFTPTKGCFLVTREVSMVLVYGVRAVIVKLCCHVDQRF